VPRVAAAMPVIMLGAQREEYVRQTKTIGQYLRGEASAPISQVAKKILRAPGHGGESPHGLVVLRDSRHERVSWMHYRCRAMFVSKDDQHVYEPNTEAGVSGASDQEKT